MPALLEYVQSAWPRVREDVFLLALPVVGTALQFGNALRALAAGPGSGVKFAFPPAFATLWSFVNVPTADGLVADPSLFAFGVVAQAALTAVYVPRAVERVRPGRGEGDPATALSRYVVPLFGVALLVAGVGLVVVVVAAVARALALAALPVVFLLGYALYAAPFLVVVEDRGALDALAASYDHATDLGPYASYAVQYLLLVAAVSLVASSFVRLGPVAIALAALASAPLAAVLTAATAAFVTDLADGKLDDGTEPGPSPGGASRTHVGVGDDDGDVQGHHWAEERDVTDADGRFDRDSDDSG